ncbi:MAG: rhodanese-like domain-containing protein [Halobacteria archaeon]|nr:rhodanese-like domain-containing protein [Halobacteria archaeon]
MTVEELRDKQDSDDDYVLVDTRNQEDYENWHIGGAVNVEYSHSDDELRGDWEDVVDEYGIDEDTEVVTVCAKGKSSKDFAEYLEGEGYDDVKSVEGGMEAWSMVYDVVPIATQSDEIEIIQLQRRSKGCLGYIVGDKATGEAAAIDVTRATKKFRDTASEYGYKITHVLDTHIHADHISGGRRLADELDVPYHLGERARTRDPDYDFDGLDQNEVLEVGENVEIKAIPTPGHTTGMTSYLINDEALTTGDTVFVESIGRTELQFAGDEAKGGAEMQYDTLHDKILSEPDTVKILPGHFSVTDGGEFIDVTPGTPMMTTVGYLRQNNRALQMDEDDFVEYMFDNIPSKPPNYEKVIATNSGDYEPEDKAEEDELELGPNRCAATEESMVADD